MNRTRIRRGHFDVDFDFLLAVFLSFLLLCVLILFVQDTRAPLRFIKFYGLASLSWCVCVCVCLCVTMSFLCFLISWDFFLSLSASCTVAVVVVVVVVVVVGYNARYNMLMLKQSDVGRERHRQTDRQ